MCPFRREMYRKEEDDTESLADLGRLAHQGELIDPGHCRAADCAVDRLPADSVLAQSRDDIRGRRGFAVLLHALGLDHPLVAVTGPVGLDKTALGIEDPRLELAIDRVPADPLRAAHHGLALGLDGELAEQEIAVVGPLAGGEDNRLLALVDPFPNQPLQLLEAVVDGQVAGRFVANGGLKPVAVFLDVNGGEAADLGCPGATARSDGGPALLEHRLQAEEPQRVDLDRDPTAWSVLERRNELVADGGTSKGALALLVDDQGPRREGRGDGRGVAGIECFREGLDQGPDGPGVVGTIRTTGGGIARQGRFRWCRAILLWRVRVLGAHAQAGSQQRGADHQIDRFHGCSFPSGIDNLTLPEPDPLHAGSSGKVQSSRECGSIAPPGLGRAGASWTGRETVKGAPVSSNPPCSAPSG